MKKRPLAEQHFSTLLEERQQSTYLFPGWLLIDIGELHYANTGYCWDNNICLPIRKGDEVGTNKNIEHSEETITIPSSPPQSNAVNTNDEVKINEETTNQQMTHDLPYPRYSSSRAFLYEEETQIILDFLQQGHYHDLQLLLGEELYLELRGGNIEGYCLRGQEVQSNTAWAEKSSGYKQGHWFALYRSQMQSVYSQNPSWQTWLETPQNSLKAFLSDPKTNEKILEVFNILCDNIMKNEEETRDSNGPAINYEWAQYVSRGISCHYENRRREGPCNIEGQIRSFCYLLMCGVWLSTKQKHSSSNFMLLLLESLEEPFNTTFTKTHLKSYSGLRHFLQDILSSIATAHCWAPKKKLSVSSVKDSSNSSKNSTTTNKVESIAVIAQEWGQIGCMLKNNEKLFNIEKALDNKYPPQSLFFKKAYAIKQYFVTKYYPHQLRQHLQEERFYYLADFCNTHSAVFYLLAFNIWLEEVMTVINHFQTTPNSYRKSDTQMDLLYDSMLPWLTTPCRQAANDYLLEDNKDKTKKEGNQASNG